MQLITQPPTSKAPAEMFTGDAWWDVIYRGEEPSRARANMVRFSPGARTTWHSHGLGQSLHIVEGVALIQARGGKLIEAHPGDIVYTPTGEEHRHGATPDHFMIHLALWEGDDTTWLEHVSDAEYGAARSTTRR
ncbi:Cupin domain protein [Streptosporangium canum]|uniref:Cupin domain protein n=1 Tax=Streptosporangium canum TaxID=324952 RepID=A0A1I3HAL9_9ACTN|nr:cupin domain-containing protein [Streptosporangium canum]SFI32600.1 Cupin domain protein [Streptosporangium canum]